MYLQECCKYMDETNSTGSFIFMLDIALHFFAESRWALQAVKQILPLIVGWNDGVKS